MLILEIGNKLKIYNYYPQLLNYYREACVYYPLSEEEEVNLLNIHEDYIEIPRGLENNLLYELNSKNIPYTYIDSTYKGEDHLFTINKNLNFKTGSFGYQDKASNDLIKWKTARLSAPTGSGKTVLACLCAYKLNKKNILFLTMRDSLINQFIKEAAFTFDIKEEDIGLIKGQKFDIKPITVASLRTISSKRFLSSKIQELKNKFSLVIFDECHYSKAITFRESLMQLNPDRLYGISATPKVRDKEFLKMMGALLGPVVVEIKESDIPGRITPQCALRKTGITFELTNWELKNKKSLAIFHKKVAYNTKRNSLIVQDAINVIKSSPINQVLITVSIVKHGVLLYNMFKDLEIPCAFPYKKVQNKTKSSKSNKEVFDWKLDNKTIEECVEGLLDYRYKVLIGTYNAFTEGFNCKSLNTVMLAGPTSGNNTVRLYQLVGRCARQYKNKDSLLVIYYSDMCNNSSFTDNWADAFKDYCYKKWGNCEEVSAPDTDYTF